MRPLVNHGGANQSKTLMLARRAGGTAPATTVWWGVYGVKRGTFGLWSMASTTIDFIGHP